MTYDLARLKAPRLSGTALAAFVAALENPALRMALLPKLLTDAGITAFRKANLTEPPSVRPELPVTGTLPAQASPPSPIDLQALNDTRPAAGPGFQFASVGDYHAAYRSGTVTPTDVAKRALDAIESSQTQRPALNAMLTWKREEVLALAAASTERWKQGRALGPFDGVPVAVKDELDVVPYPTRVGTTFLGDAPAREDATVVARLRAAGALLLGKTTMVEIGLGVTGLNLHHGTPRNPYDPERFTGGSSSGAAAAVASGLCPVAIGADGGGSIRIPAALCGLVGLKSTFGRVSEHGAAPLCWSVGHVGPLTATARDCALAWALLAGPDPLDSGSLQQPPTDLTDLANGDLTGLRIGLYRPWFEDATSGVVAACRDVLDALKRAGAVVREVSVEHLELARVAQLVTIASEMATSMSAHYDRHRTRFGLDVRTNLAIAREFTARDYVRAQQARTRIVRHWTNLFRDIDVLVTPSTGITAPPIRADALAGGESDLTTLGDIMRFAGLGNLTGFPAISFPAGYDAGALPIGIQFYGRPWEERTLLRLAEVSERHVERRAPKVHFRLLG